MSRQRSLQTIAEAEYISIGELARLTGTRYSTLKFYTEEGMLPFHQEGEKLVRRYHREESIRQLQRIRQMREEGLTIPQIQAVLESDEEE
ncbi:MAG TPA: MerR family transcriptional regulator [Candidatus Faecousia excrementigallinarum]|uniref:MerR family transcriptional regulator n=1 Tax=Candidatus Faecousia excrementigallinarum TaxID=2840806 RepID=A0A9D0Z3D2_9FIRM|nr:MerR family transcriptional regulator [Candidatus Faecousia excrementigallinarum]